MIELVAHCRFKNLQKIRIQYLLQSMGSGKTYWGRKWAQQLNLDFFDLDELIEAGQEKTIAGIFEEHGEVYFRQLESGILRTFPAKPALYLPVAAARPAVLKQLAARDQPMPMM